jgi:hypothetical protein
MLSTESEVVNFKMISGVISRLQQSVPLAECFVAQTTLV